MDCPGNTGDCTNFAIDENSGHITAAATFPPGSQRLYDLTVLAEDGAESALEPGGPNRGKEPRNKIQTKNAFRYTHIDALAGFNSAM